MSKQNLSAIWVILGAVLLFGAVVSMAQESPVPADVSVADSEPQWLWGEVESVNAQARTIQVKYLDYDTDIEKELVLTADDKTKFENAKGVEDIKPQDTISVDYLTGPDGINLAIAVSLEKLEDMEEALEDVQEPARERVGSAAFEQAEPAAEAAAAAEEPVAAEPQAEVKN
jgi:hypothetical protein